MSSFLFDALHGGMGRALDLRQAQHALSASNLANADTPGYRAKYIPFDRVLERVMDAPAAPSSGAADGWEGGLVEVEEVEPLPWAIDGNSVVAEREAVRMKENALVYDALSRGMTKRLATLKYAASDGKASG